MSPEQRGGNGPEDEGQGPDETQEFNVSDELRENDPQEPRHEQQPEEPRDEEQPEGPRDEEQDEGPGDDQPDEGDEEEQDGDLEDEEVEDDEVDDEDVDAPDETDEEEDEEEPELSEEERLAELVSAPTQEWEGLEAAEATADEPTVIQKAGSAITSSFEKVGSATTSGFKAVRSHVGFPVWLRFLTASFVIVAAVAAATSASLILYLGDIAHALKSNSIGQEVKNQLDPIPDSGAQTIMIIGSDKR